MPSVNVMLAGDNKSVQSTRQASTRFLMLVPDSHMRAIVPTKCIAQTAISDRLYRGELGMNEPLLLPGMVQRPSNQAQDASPRAWLKLR